MARLGFIHEELDIKLLILFILRRLTGEVPPETLQELCQCDDGFDYFDYSDCLAHLVDTGHIAESENGYAITDKGSRNAEVVENSLPYSVRRKALKIIEPVEEKLRRAAMIRAEHTVNENGCFVELALSDGAGEIIHLKLLCSDEQQAQIIEKNFRRGAENYYHRFSEMLTDGTDK